MKRTFMAAASIMLLGMTVGTASAATITLGGEEWTLGGANLTLSSTPSPTANQPKDTPCIICGANQPQQPTGFGFNLFGNQGNDNDLAFFSNGVVGALPQDTIGTTNYTGAFLTNFLQSVGDLALTFSIGVDMNDTNVAQTLESFFFLNLTTNTVLASYSPGPGGTLLPSIHNGTGYADYLLNGLTLAGINLGDELAFFARISGANDGPDSFFLHAEPSLAPVPLPAGIWLFGTALGGLGLLARSKNRKRRNLAV